MGRTLGDSLAAKRASYKEQAQHLGNLKADPPRCRRQQAEQSVYLDSLPPRHRHRQQTDQLRRRVEPQTELLALERDEVQTALI